ncbi:MAG: zinc-ribbon domain-containing protein [Acetivibrionales bacterium]|nr:zinc-ribbon domain-containing protein [Clostridiales bacterium]HQD30554.1 zinc-ribbon domain-containing protein [Clostridiales bacterium]
MFCENCGNQLPDGAKFCLNCGSKVELSEAADAAQGEAAAAAEAVETEAVKETDMEAASGSAPDQPTAPADTPQPMPEPSAPEQPKPQSVPIQPTAQSQDQKPSVTQIEASTVVTKPEKVDPLPVWKFIGILILQSIPIIGLVMILVWSFSGSFNRNTRNYARAVFILGLIGFILSVVFIVLNLTVIMQIMENFNSDYVIELW